MNHHEEHEGYEGNSRAQRTALRTAAAMTFKAQTGACSRPPRIGLSIGRDSGGTAAFVGGYSVKGVNLLRRLEVPQLGVAVCTSLVLGVLGCANVQMYPGSRRSDAEVARISGQFRYYGIYIKRVSLETVDGVEMSAAGGTAEVLPGRHVVTASFHITDPVTSTWSPEPCAVAFAAEGGHQYVLDVETADQRWQACVEDRGTRQRTCGCQNAEPDMGAWLPPLKEQGQDDR